jgi:hypothetical protein
VAATAASTPSLERYGLRPRCAALRHAGTHVLDEELPVANAEGVLPGAGGLEEPELAARLGELLKALAREARAPLEVGAQPTTAL